MDKSHITHLNEQSTKEWFALSEFHAEKLDSADGKKGKNADWKFTKQELVVVCETKTVFSGGQSGLTRDQWKRRRLGEKKLLDFHQSQLQEGERLIVTRDHLDYVRGTTPYSGGEIRKEEAYQKFKNEVVGALENDEEVKNLPHRLVITIDSLYVPYNHDHRKQYVDWLKGFVLWANKQEMPARLYWPHVKFTFVPRERKSDGTWTQAVESHVTVSGPGLASQLVITFIEGGMSYNQDGIMGEIEEAIGRIHVSIRKCNLLTAKTMIALWSESSFLWWHSLLFNDMIDAQLHRSPVRYELFDWVFSDERYSDLSAIGLFELKTKGTDFWDFANLGATYPFAYIITNPFRPQDEQELRNAFKADTCLFIRGLDTDPLS